MLPVQAPGVAACSCCNLCRALIGTIPLQTAHSCVQGLTFDTDISSSSADVRAAGKALLTKAMQVDLRNSPALAATPCSSTGSRCLMRLAEHGRRNRCGGRNGRTHWVDSDGLVCHIVVHLAPQKAAQFGARHFVGVTYSAMGKYPQPATPEQWQHCVVSLKVRI